jgi:nicotinamide-nucleotide amidase
MTRQDLETLIGRGVKLVTAESCTGGMVAAALSDHPGSSAVLIGGLVTYSNDAKQALLGVRAETLSRYGAVSEEVAWEMAIGALRALSEANVALAITGIAGPGGSEHKPEGRVCFAIAHRDGVNEEVNTETVEFTALGRARVREAARDHAIAMCIAGRIAPRIAPRPYDGPDR